jgi:hypothetical protein
VVGLVGLKVCGCFGKTEGVDGFVGLRVWMVWLD